MTSWLPSVSSLFASLSSTPGAPLVPSMFASHDLKQLDDDPSLEVHDVQLKPGVSEEHEAEQSEEEDDTPPPFPLPSSHQRMQAPVPSSSSLAPRPPPALSFSISPPSSRSFDSSSAPKSNLAPPPPPSFSFTPPPEKLRSVEESLLAEEDEERERASRKRVDKKALETPTTTTKVVKTREKVALAPGHSALDWARTLGSGQHQGQSLKGPITHFPQRITPSQLKQHNKPHDAWSSFNGKVYNITPYAKFHPGGEKELFRCAGRDGTKLFMATHAWVNIDMMMDACLVGFLVSE